MSEVWRRRVWGVADRMDAADRLALLALAELADGDGACRTGQRRLARMCGVGVRAVQATLGRVEASGYLRVGRVVGEVNTYQLVAERIVEAGGATDAGDDGGTVDGRSALDSGGWGAVRDTGWGAAADRTGGAGGVGRGRQAAPSPAYSAHALKDMQHAAREEADDVSDGAGRAAGELATAAAGTDGSALLRARGVDGPVATRLAEAYPDRVRLLVERFDRERAEKALGPGWLVSAIRGGWSAGASAGEGGAERPMTYAEMLRVCERTGATTDDFEAVPRPGQRPLWQKRG